MRIIRMKLDGGDVFPKKLRYNEETDTVEVTYDDGATWADDPYADPRKSTALIQAKPPKSTKCDTAANARAFLQTNINGVLDIFTDFGTAAGVVGAIVSFFMTAFSLLGPFGIIITLFFALATYLVSLGGAAIEYAFIDGEWDIVLCNIFDFTPEDGLYTQEMLDSIIGQNESTLNTTAAAIVNSMLLLMGFVGLTNAGKTGEETADCGGCAECVTFDALPTNDALFQMPCVSTANYLFFNSVGAYTTLLYPNGMGTYFDCSALCPLLGGATGWKVSVEWTGGTKTLTRNTSVNPAYPSPCTYGSVPMTATSGLLQSVPSTHPVIAVSWDGDGGATAISRIHVECDYA